MTTPVVTIERIDKGRARVYRVHGDPRVEGKDLVSVTTVLNVIAKPALIPWANKEGRKAIVEHLTPHVGQVLTAETLAEALEKARTRPDETKGAAADLGTRIHATIEALSRGQDIPIPDDVAPAVAGWRKWQAETGIRLEVSEWMVYSPSLLYAGTMDTTGWLDEGLVVVDYKSSAGIYDEAALQGAAYAHAWEEMTGKAVKGVWCVRLGKDKAEFEARRVIGAFDAFKSALALWRELREPLWA